MNHNLHFCAGLMAALLPLLDTRQAGSLSYLTARWRRCWHGIPRAL
jgi:hypothetical protein